MALRLFSNGLVENFYPEDSVFSEEEIINLFPESEEIITFRFVDILNSWCIYGRVNKPDPTDYNQIAANIVKSPVYSHVLFVHDSELNPNWKVTDNIIYKGYQEFLTEITKLIEFIANSIMREIQENDEEGFINYLPQLISVGTTSDKRILYSFNPAEQTKEFYEHDEFYIFSKKVYDFLTKNKQNKEPFTIYEDKKAVIIVDSANVKSFLDSLLEKFKSKEEYEICTNITKMIKQWPPKRKTKKISTKNNNI